MKRFIYLIAIIFLFATCKKKDLPIPTANNPVFLFEGTIGNENVNYRAGVNNMYMYTDYFKDDQNLTTVRGHFGSDTCSNCEPYLSFEAKDKEQTNSLTLSQGIALLFNSNVFTSYSLDSIASNTTVEQFSFFHDATNPQGTQYFWDFGDGTTDSIADPTHIFPPTGGIKSVKLKTTNIGLSSPVDSLVNDIDVTIGSTCRAGFSVNYDTSSNSIIVNAKNGFTNYNWIYGNGLTGATQFDSVTYNNAGKYTIQLSATKAGCTSTFSKKVIIPYPNNNALPNFDYTFSTTTVTNYQPRINSSAFIITWKKDGKTYQSFKNVKSINQSDKTIFTLTGLEMYANNEKGQKTVKATGIVDCYLYNSQNANDSIKMSSKSLTFAVAYPN